MIQFKISEKSLNTKDGYTKVLFIVKENIAIINEQIKSLNDKQLLFFLSDLNSKEYKEYFIDNSTVNLDSILVKKSSFYKQKQCKNLNNIEINSQIFYSFYFDDSISKWNQKLLEASKFGKFPSKNIRLDTHPILLNNDYSYSLIKKNTISKFYTNEKNKYHEFRYLKILQKYSFQDYVNNYKQFENSLLCDVFELFNLLLLQEGFKGTDNFLTGKNTQIKYIHTKIPLKGGYKLSIIVDDQNNLGTKSEINSTKINQIGEIRRLELITPLSIKLNKVTILNELKSLIKTCYITYEVNFLKKSFEIFNKINNNLYSEIQSHLLKKNKKHLIDKFSLLLVEGKINQVMYYFENKKLKEITNYFKNIESDSSFGISPFEMLATIMTKTFSFKKSLAIESYKERKPKSIKLVNLKYINEARDYFSVERRLINSKEATAIVPCKKRDYFLVVVFPKKYDNYLIDEILLIKENLEKLFSDNLKDYSLYFKTMFN